MATQSKLIKYSDLQKELRLEGIRELEDLIIEGTNCNVMRGKLDQKSSHFEVDWAMGRDIRKVLVKPCMIRVIFADWQNKRPDSLCFYNTFQSDLPKIEETLKNWCQSCDGMLACLEDQVTRANGTKQANTTHQKQIEQKVNNKHANYSYHLKLSDEVKTIISIMDDFTSGQRDSRAIKSPAAIKRRGS